MKAALSKVWNTIMMFSKMAWKYTLPLLGIVAVDVVVYLVTAQTPFGNYSNHLAVAIVATDVVTFAYMSGKRDVSVGMWWFVINFVTSALMLNGATILTSGEQLTLESPIYGFFVVVILFFARGLYLFVTMSDQKA